MRLGDLEGIVFHKTGQVRTEQIAWNCDAAVTGMDVLGDQLQAPAISFSLAGHQR